MTASASDAQGNIVIKNLTKHYAGSDKTALDNLTLSIKPGEAYGFLGPNGAGKSTTIRTLMNFIQPSSGEAKILGYDIVNDSVEIKKRVGYLAGDAALYSGMTGRQFLAYMHELLPATNEAYSKELIRRLKVDLDQKIGNLSRGNKQKIGIVQAFMHQPEVLILDEPSSGLDPLMQEEFYKLINEAKQREATIFMSSHVLSEVQKVCDRIGIIRQGKLISERSIAEMEKEAAQTFDITFAGKVPLAELKKMANITLVGHDDHNVTLHIKGKLAPLFSLLAKNDVTHIDTRNLDLEEMFLHFYQDEGDTR